MFSTKLSHELALKIFACYLKQTNYCGLVLDPNFGVHKLDTYPDAYFGLMYLYEKPTENVCVKNHSGFIIKFSYYLKLWVLNYRPILLSQLRRQK